MNTEHGEMTYLLKVRERLLSAPHGGKRTIITEAAQFLRCSGQEVYRRLRQKAGYQSGRKPRCDRGQCSVSEAVAVQAAALVRGATRRNGKKTTPITVALDILRENGRDADVSAATLSRAMRLHRCHPDMMARGKPGSHMKSEHPNHVWQVDASICVLFYLPKEGLRVMPEGEFYKNKPQNLARVEKQRVWRYVVTDHYSGAFYVHYLVAGGETAEGLVEVMLGAISDRGMSDPMHGVPFILMMDAGSANLSGLFLNLLERLGIRHITHLPGNPRAKGQVEQAQNLVETQFEGRLAFHRVTNVEQLQAAADRWRRHYNAWAVHSRHGKTRNTMWLTITEEQLRLAPSLELCRELVVTKPTEVKVRSDMTVTHSVKGFGRSAYDVRLLPGVVPGLKVRVVVNPYRAPAVDVILKDEHGADAVWTVEPVQMDEAGFRVDAAVFGQEFKGQPDTAADQRVKEIAEAVGDTGKQRQTGQAPYGLDVFADVQESPTYIPRRGRDLGLDASRREIPPLSHVEAARALKAALGQDYPADGYAWLVQRYPDGVPADQIDEITTRLSAPETPAGAVLKVVGGAAC